MNANINIKGIEVNAPVTDDFKRILTPGALEFAGTLARKFDGRRKELIANRVLVQNEIDSGKLPDFLPETSDIRNSDWKIAPVPDDLQDRRVEITGPVDRKMIINALNSGANTFMADFEDSHSPTWGGTIQGQINLTDAIDGSIVYKTDTGKEYKLNSETATLIVRPRGWHLVEKNVSVDGSPISASLFDFGLFFFHNAKKLINKGSGPYFYLPKLENYLEARLWNDVFIEAQRLTGIDKGRIKATVLIETILAAFQMDEIIYELKDHMAGLNCGRWDYIFSFIKKFKNIPGYIFPDRGDITMTSHCMHSYSLLAIKTCHRRGAHAIGGMAAQIPVRDDEETNSVAMDKVKKDKNREASDGHDGTWVAHPGLIQIAKNEFDNAMKGPNQIDNLMNNLTITAQDLLKKPQGQITIEGLRKNISVGVQYMAHWLNGNGCVPLYNLMEDAATAEISRTQVWQWINHPDAFLNDGRKIDIELYKTIMSEEKNSILSRIGPEKFHDEKYELAFQLFDEIISKKDLEEFLTLRAYRHLK